MPDSKHSSTSAGCLQLVAATLNHVLAELESPERLASLLDADVDPGWPPGEYDRNAQEFFRDRLREGGAAVVGWYTWYAIRRGSHDQRSALVGAGGYIGPPNEDGEVEIGFSVVPRWQNRGYATEMAAFLVVRAFADSRVQRVIAHTTSQNAASRRVLEKASFKLSSVDSESGSICFEVRRSDWRRGRDT